MKKPYCHYVVCARFDKKESIKVIYYEIEGTLTFVLSELRRIKKKEGMDTYFIETMDSFPDMKERQKQKSKFISEYVPIKDHT
jgi:hypothetical protein